jgi:hypothetical protein
MFWMRYYLRNQGGPPVIHFNHPGTRWLLGYLRSRELFGGSQRVLACAAMWAWFGGAAGWNVDDGLIITPKGKICRPVPGGDRLEWPPKAVNADFLALVSPAGAAAFQIRGTIGAAAYAKIATFEGVWGCGADALKGLT